MADSTQKTMWDEWFDGQYDISACIDQAVKELSVGKDDAFRAALLSGVLEHCAERIRGFIDLDKPVHEPTLDMLKHVDKEED